MIKRTIYLSRPCYLATRLEQLKLSFKDTEEEKSLPIEDLGVLVLDHPQITLTMGALQKLNANNTAVVCCDARHLPASQLLPLSAHQMPNERLRYQLEASAPLKKQLWQQTVRAKILNQAQMLEAATGQSGPLRGWAAEVKSGDNGNLEGIAARHYWQRLFEPSFRRGRYAATPNNLLNYGYAILRAATARALVGSGLFPALGIHHHNRYNPFCLADDIMEPYRPMVDQCVYQIWETDAELEELEREHKAQLPGVLASDVQLGEKIRPLQIALTHTTASLHNCFEGSSRQLSYPRLCL